MQASQYCLSSHCEATRGNHTRWWCNWHVP